MLHFLYTVQVKIHTKYEMKWCDNDRYCQVKFTLRYKVILQVQCIIKSVR